MPKKACTHSPLAILLNLLTSLCWHRQRCVSDYVSVVFVWCLLSGRSRRVSLKRLTDQFEVRDLRAGWYSLLFFFSPLSLNLLHFFCTCVCYCVHPMKGLVCLHLEYTCCFVSLIFLPLFSIFCTVQQPNSQYTVCICAQGEAEQGLQTVCSSRGS